MERVRIYLGLYAVVGALVLARGAAGLVADPSVASVLFAAGGGGLVLAAGAGVTRSRAELRDAPPAWAVVASTLGVILFAAGATLALI